MQIEAPKNPNYCATVVALSNFVTLPNCDNVHAALLFNNSVIVSKAVAAGTLGLFFPVETALSHDFLCANNLYRKAEWGNADPFQTGFFEQHGRVRAVKFRGQKSEGFWLPLACLTFAAAGEMPPEGATFDHFNGVEICRKYVPKSRIGKPQSLAGKQASLESSIVAGQFRFHFDTENLRRNIHKIQPNDMVSISDKWHGTSVVIANVLVRRNLPWYERVAERIGLRVEKSQYGITYSSRRVIKAVAGVAKDTRHFYTDDIWGEVAREVEAKVPAGFTIYAEIVGYTSDGQAIQPGYAYGCREKQHRTVVYRVTSTNVAGQTLELGWLQVLEFCAKYGLEPVPTLYVGPAWMLMPNDSFADVGEWQKKLLTTLEEKFVRDGDCRYNAKGTPAEGVVVRVDRLQEAQSFKLKNFRFLERESKALDKGEIDTETAQSDEATAA